MLALVDKAHASEVDWAVFSGQECSPYEYTQMIFVLGPGEGAAAGSSAGVGEGEGNEGSQSVVWLMYRTGYATHGKSLVFAREP